MINKLLRNRVWVAWLLAGAGCLATTTQAMDLPADWDLTFAAQRADAPPIRHVYNDIFNLYQTIDQRGWQIRYFLQQVPLTRVDDAVFVQHEVGTRYGLFIDGEQAWMLRNRDYSSVEMRAVDAGAARKIIRRYAQHNGPTRHAAYQVTESIACSAEVARAVVSVYANGKATQYWLSGADFCEMDTELLSPVKLILCGGHCRTAKSVSLWAEKLERELAALPAVGDIVAAPAPDRSLLLQQADQLLTKGGSVEAMCQTVNQLLDLPSPNDKIRVRTFRHPDQEVDAALVALVGRVDTRCTGKTGAPLLPQLVGRSATVVVEAALKAGFPVNDKEHQTPLDVAIFNKREDVQQILIRAGGVRDLTLGQ